MTSPITYSILEKARAKSYVQHFKGQIFKSKTVKEKTKRGLNVRFWDLLRMLKGLC